MSGEKKHVMKQAPLQVGDVPSARCDVERVLVDQTLGAAQMLMNANEYSQLAVISGTGELEGAVSWKSIARARFVNESPTLRNAMFSCKTVSPDDELLPLIDTIYKDEFMLVTDESGKPCGIITAADLAVQFRDLTDAFFQISDIERRLRHRIDSSFEAAELHAATGLESASDMTIGQYMRLLEDADAWKRMDWPQADQMTFLDCLDRARYVRNKVMHSTGELSKDEKLELGQLFNLMRTLEPQP
jgi:CBS domain-containing protein